MLKRIGYRIVCGFFLLLLLVPNIGLFREKANVNTIAEIENRTINPKPSVSPLTEKFYQQFENWYNDRVLGRKDMIRSWAILNGKLFHVLISKEIAQGKDNYLFMPYNLGNNPVGLEQKFDMLGKMASLSKARGVKFMAFFPPPGEWMLGELIQDKYHPVDINKMDAFLGRELQARKVDFFTIDKEMAALSLAERRQLFSEGDYHWTKAGAFIAAKKLLHELGYNKNIDLPMQLHKQRTAGDIYTRKVGLDPIVSYTEVPWNNHFNTNYEFYFGHQGQIISQSSAEKDTNYKDYEEIYVNAQASHDVTVLMMADSFNGNIKDYLLQDVKTLILVHNCEVSGPKKSIDIRYLLDTYKPDAFIYEKVGGFFLGDNLKDVCGNIKL